MNVKLGAYVKWYGERTWWLELYERVRKWH